MTDERKVPTIALVGGPLNGHDDEQHVMRALDHGVIAGNTEKLPDRITATPAGLFYNLNVPARTGRYELANDDEARGLVDVPVQPDAVYVWRVPEA